jgi:hypothetical protein
VNLDLQVDATTIDVLLEEFFQLSLMLRIQITIDIRFQKTIVDRTHFGQDPNLGILNKGLPLSGHAK